MELLGFGFNINTSNGILRFRLQSQYSNSRFCNNNFGYNIKIQNVFLFLLGCCQDAMISWKYSQNSIRSIHFQDHWQFKSSLSFLLLKVLVSWVGGMRSRESFSADSLGDPTSSWLSAIIYQWWIFIHRCQSNISQSPLEWHLDSWTSSEEMPR